MIGIYMDECVHGGITRELRRHGVDVVTAQEDGRSHTRDPQVMDRAQELGRVLFSNDPDMLMEAVERLRTGRSHPGLVFAHQNSSISICVADLELIASCGDADEYVNRIQYLPLK